MQGRVGEERTSLAEDVRQRPLRLLFSDAGTKQSKDGWLPTQRSGIAAEQLIEVPFNGVSKECLMITYGRWLSRSPDDRGSRRCVKRA